MSPYPTRRLAAAALAASLALFGAVGCSSDDDAPTSSPTAADGGGNPTPATDDFGLPDDELPTLPGDSGGSSGGGGNSLADQCDAYAELGRAIAGLTDEGPAAVATRFAEVAPIDIGADAQVVADAIVAGDPEVLAGDEVAGSLSVVGNFFADLCEVDEDHELTAAEEGVTNFPTSLSAGRLVIELTNLAEGKVDLVLAQRDEGDDRTVEELEALSVDELAEGADPVGVVWVASGNSAAWLFDLEPGSYLAISSAAGTDELGAVTPFEVTA